MSDQENPSTVELPRRERNPVVLQENFLSTIKEDNLQNTKTTKSKELSINDTHYSQQAFKFTEQKRNDSSEQSDPLDIQENRPLKIQHKTEKTYRPADTNNELEDLRDELFKLENEGIALKEESGMLDIRIRHFKDSFSEQSLETLEEDKENILRELEEQREFDKELSSLLEEKDQQGIQFALDMKKRDEKINGLLNQLSETKYKILELQEQ